MADYHMQYSFKIEDLKPEEVAWFNTEFDAADNRNEKRYETEDEWINLGEWELVDDDSSLWFHGYEGFSADLADMFQAFLKEHRPDGYIAFEWANTCTKDRLDGFSGGACFVTAEKAEWNGTHSFIDDKTREFENHEVC